MTIFVYLAVFPARGPHHCCLVAVALAVDAFAVDVASGLYISRLRLNHALRIAGMFGVFQGAMPLAGWLAGRSTQQLVAAVYHWLVFVLLAGIGGKMIYEAGRLNDRRASGDSIR